MLDTLLAGFTLAYEDHGLSLAPGEPIEIETRFRRADGEYRWFLARAVPLRDDQGNILKWYEVLTDIEDRKQAEAALRESEQRFRDYAEIASDWLWETGPDHRFTKFSVQHPFSDYPERNTLGIGRRS